MTIRPITANDTGPFFEMMCRLDGETDFMLYEPGERREKTKDTSLLREKIESSVSAGDLFLIAVADGGEPVGFISAERGRLNRVRHTAYIVVGLFTEYRRRGIGTEFFRRLDQWARSSGVTRLELTVECANEAAIKFYEKSGFKIEGTRSQSMKVNGVLTDEFYMGKIIDAGK